MTRRDWLRLLTGLAATVGVPATPAPPPPPVSPDLDWMATDLRQKIQVEQEMMRDWGIRLTRHDEES